MTDMAEEEVVLGIGSQVQHSEYGKGVIVEVNLSTYTIYFKHRGEKEINQTDSRLSVDKLVKDEVQRLSLKEVETVLEGILRKWSDISDITELGDRWKGGNMVLTPGKEGLQAKEIPIETFFHKIVMTRDRLRVMEQKINASKNLDDEEKVALQQYISRIYGSLTTFNVLFANKEDHFKSS